MTEAEIEKLIKQSSIEVANEAEKRFDKILEKSAKESNVRMQAYIAKLNEGSKEQMEQYIGAIHEESKHNIAAVGEQYLGLNEKVDRIEAVSNATFEEVGNMRVELTISNETQKNHEERITVLEEKVR